MHLESAETDLTPRSHQSVTSSTAINTDERPPSREGLPAAFKMRHGRHYVEQLMGDAPLRTVREIALADVEPPDAEPVDVDELQRSIQDVGILQPLLVSPIGVEQGGQSGQSGQSAESNEGSEQSHDPGNRYRIIAGANRYRAAVQLKLRSVPCLVYETGAHSLEALREAATRRAAPPVSAEFPMPSLPDDSRQSPPVTGLREVTARLAFVSAVMPALDVAGYDPLRWNILTDLMKVEMERARSTAAAVEWLSSSPRDAVRDTIDAAAVLEAVLDAVGPEARLQGVKLEVSSTLAGYALQADRAMLVRALIALFQGMLALSPAGSTLQVECGGTTVRPALIVAIAQNECDMSATAADRFFDAGFSEHPNGDSGALVLASVAHVARLHGGRVHARAHGERGCTATFVVPKRLDDV